MKKSTVFTPWFFGCLVLGVTALALFPGPAPAASQAPAKATAQKIEAITVTATKSEEKTTDIPATLSVFTGMDVDEKTAGTLAEMAGYTPGLDVGDYGAALKQAPALRGIYSDYSSRTTAAGLYIDGVPVLDGTGFDATLSDIERIEVLKGPQGTLYGKNTEVGVINVITKKPGNLFEGRVSLEAGENNKRQGGFALSGPVVKDKLFIGVSGKTFRQDGIIENGDTGEIIDDKAHDYGKINLRWTPTPDLEAFLVHSKVEYDDGANRMNITGGPDKKVFTNQDDFNRSHVCLSSLNLNWGFSDQWSLTSVTSRREYHEKNRNDFDYTTQTLFHVSADSTFETLAQEVRLAYAGKRIKALAGVYMDDGEIRVRRKRVTPGGTWHIRQDEDGNALGLFTHLTWDMTDRLSVLGGVRYDVEEKDYQIAAQQISVSETWHELSPKLALQYRLFEEFMVFATAAKGYRAGGFNAWSPTGYPLNYDKEYLWSYEAGAKAGFWDGRGSVEASVYYMDIKDMQVDVYISYQDVYKSNAAQGASSGAEVQLVLMPLEGLTATAGLSYNHTEFDQYKDALGDYQGNRFPFAPEYQFNLGLQYRAGNGIYAGGDIVGYGTTFLDRENRNKRSAYELVNLKAGYETETLDIYAYAKNIFDKTYDSNGIYGGYTVYSMPRELGMNLVYRF